MAKFTGLNLTMSVGGTMITANELKTVSIPRAMDTVESTGATDTDKTYQAVQRGATATVEMWSTNSGSSAGSASGYYLFKTAMAAGSAGTAMIVYPEGSAAGKRTISFNAYPTALNESHGYNAMTAVSVTLQITGAITDTTL